MSSFQDDALNRTFTCNGLRYVKPYRKTIRIRVTKRHEGSFLKVLKEQVTPSDVNARRHANVDQYWTEELARRPMKVVLDALKKLPCGGEPTASQWTSLGADSMSIFVSAGDLIEVHRCIHERCVSAEMPKILLECTNTGLVAVEKPAGVPVLAGVAPGVSGYGNVVAMVSALRQKPVWAVNRIDAAVSGIWLCATSSKLAAKANQWMAKTSRGKIYLALVRGADLECSLRIDAKLARDKDDHSIAVVDAEHGKVCATSMYVLHRSSENDTALVACKLEDGHGRYHQIRAHLSSIGHPIVNDTAYETNNSKEVAASSYSGRAYVDDEKTRIVERNLHECRDPLCDECTAMIALTADTDITNKPLAGHRICLHALRYQFSIRDVDFDIKSAELPTFARAAMNGSGSVDSVIAHIETLTASSPRYAR